MIYINNMSNLLIAANILGYIGFVMLYLQIVLGSRHVFKFFTKNTVAINKLHSKLGKYAILAVLAHPLLSMMNRLEDLDWIFVPSFNVPTETYISLGRFALFLFFAVWLTSALLRAKLKWHPWKLIHLLAYPLVILIFIHIKSIGTFYEDYALIQALWAFLLIVLWASIFYRLLMWSGLTKQKYILVDKKLVGTDIMLIKIAPKGRAISSQIGQHFFLQTKAFTSEHPFSIIRNEEGTLTFGIRRVAKFWDKLSALSIGDTINGDGPYGNFTAQAQNTEAKIIISAGIGVTPFIDLADKFGANTTYINCNRKIDEAVERELIKSRVSRYVDIVDSYDGAPEESIIVGRISEEMITKILGQEHHDVPVFVCGSPGFIGAIKKMFANLGTPPEMVYYEELGF